MLLCVVNGNRLAQCIFRAAYEESHLQLKVH